MDRFVGRVAIVTGASRGIGFAIAERLVAEGARVVLTARSDDALQEAVRSLGGSDVALGVAGRADDVTARTRAFEAAETLGGVDLLVNNAGINPTFGPLLALEDDVARKILDVNLLATLAWSREALDAGLRKPGGSIVNLASIAGIAASPGIAAYGVSKAAVIGLTTQLAVELAPDVRVNAVAPAVVRTRFARALYEGHEAEAAAKYPLGRLGEPGDIAGPVAFLLSEDAAWITGQTIVIDGGATLAGPA